MALPLDVIGCCIVVVNSDVLIEVSASKVVMSAIVVRDSAAVVGLCKEVVIDSDIAVVDCDAAVRSFKDMMLMSVVIVVGSNIQCLCYYFCRFSSAEYIYTKPRR